MYREWCGGESDHSLVLQEGFNRTPFFDGIPADSIRRLVRPPDRCPKPEISVDESPLEAQFSIIDSIAQVQAQAQAQARLL